MTTDTQDFIAQLRNTGWARPLPCTACHKIADALQALQAEVGRLKAESYKHQGDALMMTGERDAALARLAELEKQEPVGWHTTANSIVGLFHHDGTPIDGYEAGWKLVYAASGASPVGPIQAQCQACGSDCNERDELIKAEREIERLNAQPSQAGELSDLEIDEIATHYSPNSRQSFARAIIAAINAKEQSNG